jgi:hypothetical protein
VDREFVVILSVTGFEFPDVDRLMKWLECTALERESIHRYLPDGAAVMVRGVTSNLPEDAPYVDPPEAIMGESLD